MAVPALPAFPAPQPARRLTSHGPRPRLGPRLPPLTRDWRAPFPVSVRLTLSAHGRGGGDPTYRVDPAGAVWRTSLTPEGPATLRVLPERGLDIAAAAWGPGAAWLLGTLPEMLGAGDTRDGFDPAHPLLRQLAARHPGLRVTRSQRVMEALVPAVLEQKVVSIEAHRAWRILLTRFGAPAPGPAPHGMRVVPPPRGWAAIPSWEWHRAGVEMVRARTIGRACGVAGRLEEIATLSAAEASRRLQLLPGIGVWTAAETMQRAFGDPDAVSVGDYNLPKAVGWALAGRRVDDAGMLELLAPYAGHRYRVTRLIELSGIRPPRRGPRMPVRDYRHF
ncbi:MAG TPA: DNA-3-methyladenine glycosylase 2 family protein [Streptosporangiaceae bacterium]